MQSALPLIASGILAIIAYVDVRTRRIPNALCIAIAALGLMRIILIDDPVSADYTLGMAAATFGATFLLFWYGVIGGGDAKLIAAMALLVGHQEVLSFLFLMSVMGGALALVAIVRDLVKRVWRPAGVPAITPTILVERRLGQSAVPYGVAIAAAGAITLLIAG
jgi:prepilin peptidase CpaA